jgi:hypothetical protein
MHTKRLFIMARNNEISNYPTIPPSQSDQVAQACLDCEGLFDGVIYWQGGLKIVDKKSLADSAGAVIASTPVRRDQASTVVMLEVRLQN